MFFVTDPMLPTICSIEDEDSLSAADCNWIIESTEAMLFCISSMAEDEDSMFSVCPRISLLMVSTFELSSSRFAAVSFVLEVSERLESLRLIAESLTELMISLSFRMNALNPLERSPISSLPTDSIWPSGPPLRWLDR